MALVVLAVLATLLLVGLIVTVLRWAPQWLASTSGLNASQRADEVGRVRTALIAVLAGSIAIVGVIYTARTFALNRQGQITERFTRAVDQLGNERVEVRLGGIYALERLARESRSDHGPIVEILTAYVREHATAPSEEDEEELVQQAPEIYPKPPEVDVQAALTVLGRRKNTHDPPPPWRLDLSGAYLPRTNLRHARLGRVNLSSAVLDQSDLRGADLWEADLTDVRMFHANLGYAQLGHANCTGARLNEANLAWSRMPEAILAGASLRHATLAEARLQGADLTDADLDHADLADADLQGATLFKTNLGHALLRGANLVKAELAAANLEHARCSDDTTWPDGFKAEATGATFV